MMPSNINGVSSGQRARMAEPDAGAPQASATNVRVGDRTFTQIRTVSPTRDQPGVKPEVKDQIQTLRQALEGMRKNVKDALIPKLDEHATNEQKTSQALLEFAFANAYKDVSDEVVKQGKPIEKRVVQQRVEARLGPELGNTKRQLDALKPPPVHGSGSDVDMTVNDLYGSGSDAAMTVNQFYGSSGGLAAGMTVNSGVEMRGNAVRAGAPDQVQNAYDSIRLEADESIYTEADDESIYTEVDYEQLAEPPKGASGLSKPRTTEPNSSQYFILEPETYDRADTSGRTRARTPEPDSSEYSTADISGRTRARSPERSTSGYDQVDLDLYNRVVIRPSTPEANSNEELYSRPDMSGRTRVNAEADQATYNRIGAEEDMYVDGSSLQKDLAAQPAKPTPPPTPPKKPSDGSSLAQPAKPVPPPASAKPKMEGSSPAQPAKPVPPPASAKPKTEGSSPAQPAKPVPPPANAKPKISSEGSSPAQPAKRTPPPSPPVKPANIAQKQLGEGAQRFGAVIDQLKNRNNNS